MISIWEATISDCIVQTPRFRGTYRGGMLMYPTDTDLGFSIDVSNRFRWLKVRLVEKIYVLSFRLVKSGCFSDTIGCSYEGFSLGWKSGYREAPLFTVSKSRCLYDTIWYGRLPNTLGWLETIYLPRTISLLLWSSSDPTFLKTISVSSFAWALQAWAIIANSFLQTVQSFWLSQLTMRLIRRLQWGVVSYSSF